MKKSFIILVSSLTLAGCMTRQPSTAPKQEPQGTGTLRGQEVVDEKEPKKDVTEDAPTPEVSGYGQDPGEETQE